MPFWVRLLHAETHDLKSINAEPIGTRCTHFVNFHANGSTDAKSVYPSRHLKTSRGTFDMSVNSNLALRQALAYAVPYDDIVFGVLKDRAAKSAGPMSVNSRFFALYNLADMPSYYTDLDKARELLAEAGHGDGFAFELITAKGVPHVAQAAASLKASFAKIGVDMTITPVSQATMAEKNGQGTYDAYMRDWSTDYVDDPFYHFFLFVCLRKFAENNNSYSPRFYRIINEIPTILLIGIIIIVVFKPL